MNAHQRQLTSSSSSSSTHGLILFWFWNCEVENLTGHYNTHQRLYDFRCWKPLMMQSLVCPKLIKQRERERE
ncbi:hypothetical protein GBA52_005276 [Prunus armeniaca]|nr:hypothetical protein GBA52_005276 [Prunus armeniaca]